jgi:hypothetical protein
MIGKVTTPNELRWAAGTHGNVRGFMQQSSKSESVRTDAGTLKAGFGAGINE